MKKGDKVKLFVQTSKFECERKKGVIKEVIKSKMGKDLIAVQVDNVGFKPEYQVHYRFENELKQSKK